MTEIIQIKPDLFTDVRPLSKTALHILQKRYFWEGETTWEQLVNRVMDCIYPDKTPTIENAFEREMTREMILNRYFLPNSPTLANSGKSGAGLCACYVVDFKDSIDEIYKTKYEFALIARKGGGCGTTLSNLRPKGSPVKGSTHGYAGGPVAFADTISHDMSVITQGGMRPMAIIFVMSVYHPDIFEFIDAKKHEGKIENANMSVMVDNKFMQAVKDDKTYWTEFGGKKYQQYRAREIFDKIVEGAWRNGEPGILFQDRINDSPYKYTGQIIQATNPCLHKDTLVLGQDRLVRISKSDEKINSWKTGVKNSIKLITNAGHEIVLTPEHMIMLENGNFIEAKDSLHQSIAWGLGNLTGVKNRNAQILGFLFGDGYLCGGKDGVSVKLNKNKESEIYDILIAAGFHDEKCGNLYCNKKELSKKLKSDFGFLSFRTFDRDIPENILLSNSNFVCSFLSGLFEANGSVTINNQISFKSTNKKQVKNLQILLSAFGIESWIVENKPRLIQWCNGDYTSRESYNLQIAPRNAFKFKEKIGFISNKKNDKIKKLLGKYNSKLKIVSIENVGKQEVWDFNNSLHYSLANGVFAHNCAEQSIPANGVCNLGSLDLSKFVEKDKSFNWEKLHIAVRLGIRFLDRVIDKTSYPTPDIEMWSKRNRPVGLGIMGFADLCLIKEIAYGSEESIGLLTSILSKMYEWAKEESELLGNMLGVPEECKKLPEPRRNITLLTIAPTGTTSLFSGCSNGIEPIFSEIVVRNDKTGTYVFETDLANKPYFRCAVSTNGPEHEVTWEEHIRILAAAQGIVDSGVSKTANFPNMTHKETIGKAFMMAWETGCKGLAVYRNGSREKEVLSPKNIQKEKCPLCGKDIKIEDGVKKCTDQDACKWKLKEQK